MPNRSIVYIDGFNFYYGALRGGPHKWLNVEQFFRLLRHGDDIQRIRYYTALVAGPAQARQLCYLKALETLPLVEISLGRFKARRAHCRVAACSHSKSRIFQMPEEKRTDVNIAVDMIDDAYQDLCDRLLVVSGDSDLVPAVNRVKTRFPEKQITVYVPSRDRTRGAAVELRSSADRNRTLPLELLRRCQFPAKLPNGTLEGIRKPPGW